MCKQYVFAHSLPAQYSDRGRHCDGVGHSESKYGLVVGDLLVEGHLQQQKHLLPHEQWRHLPTENPLRAVLRHCWVSFVATHSEGLYEFSTKCDRRCVVLPLFS